MVTTDLRASTSRAGLAAGHHEGDGFACLLEARMRNILGQENASLARASGFQGFCDQPSRQNGMSGRSRFDSVHRQYNFEVLVL